MDRESVLILHRWYPVKDIMQKRMSKLRHNYNLNFVCSFVTRERFADHIIEECREVIEAKNISVIVSTDDWGSLIHSALCEKYYPQIRSASFESEFLAMHKLYTRHIIASKVPGANLRYGYCNTPKNGCLNENAVDKSHIGLINTDVNLSELEDMDEVIVKPYMSTGSENIATVNRTELPDFLKEKVSSRHNMYKLSEQTRMFIQAYLTKYDLRSGYILEEYYNSEKRVASIHTCDLMIQNKQVMPLVLGDNIYWPAKPTCFKGFFIPSLLQQSIKDEMETTLRYLAEQLINFGYNNQFINGEFILAENEGIKLMEINGRCGLFQLFGLCEDILDNGNLLVNAIKLGLGETVQPPKIVPGKYGLNAYINVFNSGIAGELIDFNEARKHEEISLYCEEDTRIEQPKGDCDGVNLGFVDVVGSSYEDCFTKAQKLIKKISKGPMKCLWMK